MEATGQKTLAEAWQERQDDLNCKNANGKLESNCAVRG